MLITNCNNELKDTKSIADAQIYNPAAITPTRESITFILGEDKEDDNPYYKEAIKYYLYNEVDKTDYVVTDCRSLSELLNYLKNNLPANRLPWGIINLVSHGNQWTGLSVAVAPKSGRATPERIREYTENGTLKELADNIIDEQTIIYIHGCGTGNNHQLIENIAVAMGGKGAVPVVKASRLFEFYASMSDQGMVTATQRYNAKAWFQFYRMGYLPGKEIIEKDFRSKYPQSKIDWNYALSKTQPAYIGDTYHYTFEVPLKWIIRSHESDSLSDLSDSESCLVWIKKQKEITESLSKLEIPVEKFNWWLRKVYVKNSDGTKSKALWIKGYCTLVCVLQPLVDESSDGGLLPKPLNAGQKDDDSFYIYRNNYLHSDSKHSRYDNFLPVQENTDYLFWNNQNF